MNVVKKIVKGVTMLEMLLVLAIIAILLILATRYYMSTSYSQKVSQLQATITSIQAAAANWRNSNPSANTVNINTLYGSGFLSRADLNSTQTAAFTPWRENIGISLPSPYRLFRVSFTAATDDSKKACKAVADALQSNLGGDTTSTTTARATCDTASGAFNYYF